MSSSDAHQSRHPLGERTPSVHRVRFEDSNEGSNEDSSLTAPTPSHHRDEAAPEWHFPNYGGPNALPTGVNEAIPPNDRSIPFAQAAHNSVTPKTEPGGVDNVSFSSYRHPHDIPPPTSAYTGDKREHTPVLPLSLKKAGIDHGAIDDHEQDMVDGEDLSHPIPGEDGAGGLFSNVLHKLGVDHYDFDEEVKETHEEGDPSRPVGYKKTESFLSMDAQVLDPDDPIVTGVEKKTLDDPKDLENNVRRTINYHVRRKDRQRFRIEFNISSVLNRQKFLMRLAKSLMSFGAPSHRIEAQLLAAARILEIDAEFIHIPGVIICSFGDQDADTSELHFVKCNGRLSLGSLHKVHHIYRQVVHDEISAKAATGELDALLESPPIYNFATRIALAFWISALICPLAFGGSLIDMWIAGVGASFLSIMQIGVASKSQLYANVFEVTVTIITSFAARGLSSIRDQIFCYTAISSASIVGILPGFLILSSSLELASKNIICGSVKMVYALIYTLFLGFGLQIGSDVYLLLDRGARRDLADMAKRVLDTVKITGAFASDNSSSYLHINNGLPLQGVFTFTNPNPLRGEHIKSGCYRPPTFSWYMQPFPWWTQFIIVPLFSILSSCSNLQPILTIEMVVMVLISCAAYAANKAADHFIFNRSDVVSALGAFVVGILGNMYSRKMGGTAFTSMVTGVLFLVPSGLSQIGAITAEGSGIDIGAAVIAVAIGITVGLYMSQAIVYMFGSRKNAALFSF